MTSADIPSSGMPESHETTHPSTPAGLHDQQSVPSVIPERLDNDRNNAYNSLKCIVAHTNIGRDLVEFVAPQSSNEPKWQCLVRSTCRKLRGIASLLKRDSTYVFILGPISTQDSTLKTHPDSNNTLLLDNTHDFSLTQKRLKSSEARTTRATSPLYLLRL